MNPSVLALLALTALLAGCGAQDGSRSNVLAADAGAGQTVDSVVYEAGALDAPPEFPPKEAPSLDRFIPVRMGRFVEWAYHDHPEPVGYRMGEMTVIVRGPESRPLAYSGSVSDPVFRQVRVKAPGRAEYVLEEETGAGLPTLLGHGRFDRAGTPYLLMQSETGGNHCCRKLEIFIVRPKRIEHVEVDLSARHGTPDVRDLDGDGMVDFTVSDGAFIHRFTSRSDGRSPPRVLNVVGGEVRDVSARPGFRPLLAQAARELREECLHPDRISPNGACAAYVAAAGRAGNFGKAWAEMLKAYDRKSKDGLEAGCRVPIAATEYCPKGLEIYRGYPQALRAFLRKQGFPAG